MLTKPKTKLHLRIIFMSDVNEFEPVAETEANDELPADATKPKRPRKKYEVSVTQFVQAWTQAGSVDEVANLLQMPKNILLARASGYRSKGVELKKMPRKNNTKIDVAALNSLIADTNQAQAA
jgi:hypothetical protein